MMKKSYLLFLILVANIYGQTYTGFVKDVSGTEISYVIIEELDSESEEKNWTISDERGGFSINTKNNSNLLFQRIGFKDVLVKPEDRLSKSIVMVKESISLEKVDVYGAKKEEYLKSIELLSKLIQTKGTKKELERTIAIGSLIESTDFLNISPDKKKTLKENMIWCNSQYEKYNNEN